MIIKAVALGLLLAAVILLLLEIIITLKEFVSWKKRK